MIFRRTFIQFLAIGAYVDVSKNSNALTLKSEPLTLEEKVSHAPYIVLAKVERLDFARSRIANEGTRLVWEILDGVPDPATKKIGVVSLQVSRVLKAPVGQGKGMEKIKALVHKTVSPDDMARTFSVGRELIWFLALETHVNSAPPEFFDDAAVFSIPNYRPHGERPDPLDKAHLEEVLNCIARK